MAKRLTLKQAKAMGIPIAKARKSKYRNVVTVVDGIRFHSKKEAKRYSELRLLEKLGKIGRLRLQVHYVLVVNRQRVATYVADFVYLEYGDSVCDDREVVEDTKGCRTREYILKRKLMMALYAINIKET